MAQVCNRMVERGGAAFRPRAGIGNGFTAADHALAQRIASWRNETREQAMTDDREAHGG